MNAGSEPAKSPGFRVRSSPYPDVDVRISKPETASRAHLSLLDAGLDEWLIDALVELRAEQIGDTRRRLWEIEADAAGGAFAAIASEAAHVNDARDRLLDLARALGHGQTPLDVRSDRSDLEAGPARILEAAEEITPTIAVEISGSWFEDRRREHREDVLELLADLARGCDVILELTGMAARQLHEQHRADLPAHVTSRLDPRSVTGALVDAGEIPGRVQETVADALDDLDPDGSCAHALRALSAQDSQAMTYDELQRELRLNDGHARNIALRLADRDLVERLSRPDGRTVVSLLPAGQATIDSMLDTHGQQARLSTSWAAPDEAADGDDRGRNDPPKILPPCRVNPREVGGREAGDATDGDRTDRYQHGAVGVSFMSRSRHAAASSSASGGEISLIDASIDRQEDGRTPAWSWDISEQQLVVGAEFHNPMQFMVCLARGLSSPLMWDCVLDEDRLEDVLDDPHPILRHGRNLGWFGEEDATPTRYIERLQEAHDQLLDMTRALKHEDYDDRDAFRGEILCYAQGIHGVVSHLCELADIDIVREARIPEFSRHWSKQSRRQDLCRTLSIASAIGSSYGHFVPYRLLLEDREDRRAAAIEPDVDSTDPYAELIGSFVVVGDGVDDLEGQLRATLQQPMEIHPDAPELQLRVPVRSEPSPAATWRAARHMADAKNMEIGRDAVAWIHSIVRSPYAAAAAFDAIATEDLFRELQLDELRVALGSLDEDQILPDASPSARSGVLALIRAETEISQAELARRAGITAQSWRNHRDALVAAGFVEQNPKGWRVRLPFADDRWDDHELPWTIAEDSDRLLPLDCRQQRDVLQELVVEVDGWGVAAVDDALQWPPDPAAIRAALEAIDLGCLSGAIQVSIEIHEVDPEPTLLGPRIDQQPIPAAE